MIIAMSEQNVIAADPDGFLAVIPINEMQVDWRYDFEAGGWIDFGLYEEPDGSEEATDDGGSEVSGRISEADGTDGSDSGDEGYGAPWGVDSREEATGEE